MLKIENAYTGFTDLRLPRDPQRNVFMRAWSQGCAGRIKRRVSRPWSVKCSNRVNACGSNSQYLFCANKSNGHRRWESMCFNSGLGTGSTISIG